MPELPEVEHARCVLNRWLKGRRVVGACLSRGRPLIGSAGRLRSALIGSTAAPARRRGKHLLVPFTRSSAFVGSLYLHLGMTGRIVVLGPGTRRPSHLRLVLTLADGTSVALRDPRRFGRVRLVASRRPCDVPGLERLGPDPCLDRWDADVLAAAMAGTRRAVKEALMDQSRIAGLGNIQAAEALHVAGVHPLRAASDLRRAERARLAEAITTVLGRTRRRLERARRRQARRFSEGDAMALAEPLYLTEGGQPEPFLVYDREGEPCVVCGTAVARIVQGGRSTYLCPGCQPRTGAAPSRRVRSGRRPS